MGLFEGIEDAEIFERGKYLAGGFRGVLECQRTIAKETIKSGLGFIVEFNVIETNMPDAHPIGSRCTWFQKMSDKTVAWPAIKVWAAAMSGYGAHQKEEIEREVSPALKGLLNAATSSPADNDLVGIRVCVETEQVKTKNDKDFTRHTWAPYQGAP